jgi:D-alanyl-lipoteichoic acid acyltransferase DltB (MBOAT superfamily)
VTFFLTLPFYGAALLAAALDRAAARTEKLRPWVFLALNAGMVGWLLWPVRWQAPALAVLTVGIYAIARGVARAPKSRAWRFASQLAIAGVLLFLAVLKYSFVQALLLGAPGADADAWDPTRQGQTLTGFVGVSYFAMRFIQVLVDAPKGRVRALDFPTFASFVWFFPTFVSGPIDRYERFAKDVANPAPLDLDAIGRALLRIAIGVVKKLVLATLCFELSFAGMGEAELIGRGGASVLGTVAAYGLFIYFDFSGYTDMAIGVARLFGVTLPENFDRPFAARNIQELWNRWHMTLTAFLRDYLYYPLTMALMRLTGQRTGPAVPALGILLTFIVMGVWHGDAWVCLLYGLWHGAGLAGFKLFETYVKRVAPRAAAWMLRSRAWYALAVLLTWTFFFAGLVVFSGQSDKLVAVAAALAEKR